MLGYRSSQHTLMATWFPRVILVVSYIGLYLSWVSTRVLHLWPNYPPRYSTCIFIIIFILPVQVNKCVLYPRGTDCVEANMASTAMMALAAASEARMLADETPLKNQFLAF